MKILCWIFVVVLCFLVVAARAIQPIVPDAPVMKLNEIGLYSVGCVYRGGRTEAYPDGWTGMFDDRTGIACQPAGEQNGKQAFLLHCPWRNGTGVTYQEFPFRLPAARRILLRGATALRSDAVGKSDGVTFRVFVNGRKLLEENQIDATWKPFQFDLTPFAGKVARVRFETDPGPKDDASFDFALWGDRELVIEGSAFPPYVPRPAPALPLSRLWPQQNAGVAPPNAYGGQTSARLEHDVAVLQYDGSDGTFVYRWRRPPAGTDSLFGPISLSASFQGAALVTVPLAGDSRMEWARPASVGESHWAQAANGVTLIRMFRLADQLATVKITGRLIGKSLVFDVTCDRSEVQRLVGGSWGPTLRRRGIPIPYYTGAVFALPAEGLFVSATADWTASDASSLEGTTAAYLALTDGSRNALRERIVFSVARGLDEVLPNIPNPPSPYRRDLGGRIVLDVWGGPYRDIARSLEALHGAGVTDCAVIIHDWQRSGYDNALPDHLPAAADKGGDTGMKDLVSTAVQLGFRIALHENYVDYYPNYDAFNPEDIARDSAGKRIPAWFNPGTGLQSFAVKPTAEIRLAQTQSPEIHRRYGTNADYLDVHSSVPPWFHVDMRAGEQGAGTFAEVFAVHSALWRFERSTHQGPVFGEGANHWYWSGLLDGVEAQFGAGWPGSQGMSAPLMVDFDLLKIHPLQFNHGMGYYERWWSNPTWGQIPPMQVLDQYRMQEVAFGHAGFLGAATWSHVPLAWLEHNLLSPVTLRYATAKPVDIQYRQGNRWVGSTAAAMTGDWTCVQVRYDNGLTITANGGQNPIATGTALLPRFGWKAEGAGVEAWTALKDGVIADYAATSDTVFANARRASDWSNSGITRIRPTVIGFAPSANRSFQFTYQWRVADRLAADYACFVHFTKHGEPESRGSLLFQQDHTLSPPTSRWRPGQTVVDGPYTVSLPDSLSDGTFDWYIGLDSPEHGRASLEGADDGHGRILLGVIDVRERGKTITFQPDAGQASDRLKQYAADLNTAGKTIDFGPLRTNGCVLIRRESGTWVLKMLPGAADCDVELSAARFGKPPRVQSVQGTSAFVTPLPVGSRWRLPLNGATEYRWPAR